MSATKATDSSTPSPQESENSASQSASTPTPHTQSTGELEQQLNGIIYNLVFQVVALEDDGTTNELEAVACTEILALIRTEAYRLAIKELEQAHRAGGTANYDNATDEYIDERIERLQSLVKEGTDNG